MHQILFRLGAGGDYSAHPEPLARRGPTSKGDGKEGREKEGRGLRKGREGKEREGRKCSAQPPTFE